MKRILIIGEIILTFILLLGCSVQKDIDNSFLKESLVVDEISYIEIEIDIYKQVITDTEGLDSLVSIINDIEILANSSERKKDIKEHDMARIKIYNKSKDIIESLSIGKEILYYNNKWYLVNIQIYNKIIDFYNNSDYKIVKDDNLLDIKQKRLNREEKIVSEGLRGTWIGETATKIKFDKNYLYQGSQYKYIFEYSIDKINDSNLDVSVYGMEGVFIKEKELFISNIKMDETKTCMVIKKTMSGGTSFHENFIYVDGDDISLGAFDEYFFYQHGKHY